MSRYDDPGWYEQQPEDDRTKSPQSHAHAADDFDHYPFLPSQDANNFSSHQREAVTYPPLHEASTTHRFQHMLGRILALVALVVVAFLGGWFGHQYFGEAYFNQNNPSQSYEALFQQAWNKVDQNYVDRKSIDYKKMSYAAINAMIATLGDKGHTRFMDPQAAQAENQQLSGKFTGVGIYLSQDKTSGKLIVTAPIPGSPAEKAGIKHGDVIIAVNGKSTAGKDTAGVSSMIQGKVGTNVTITVQRAGEAQPRTFQLTRSEINVPNVIMHYIPETHTAHIQVVQFADGVSGQVKDQLAKAKSMGATNIILDLRDNPGGFLNEAVNMTSLFVKSGHVLLQQDSSGKRVPIDVTGNTVDTTSPMVVLVNGNSASAAEIVSGSLKENGRATVIGERTYGTGTVLQPFNLADGSQLLIGTQEWLTPQGHFIRNSPDKHDGGITPNIEVKLPATGTILTPNDENQGNLNAQQILKSKDTQLIKAIQYLQEKK
ncbi:S41 family peptidase [Dictyobacter aurantiacus]|uniref:Carboxyl-terminal processing protease n=1 Tax=Dictyobacter aurantiacus TaxID=1936993 RepID=A0A401Z8Y2_9CHLR|nr:S41 family peptidase [Dictyobacter aurantiacus]GCE03283.1 carboxyl-terminal processing protease [Dictyobacter aurantiacus]